MPGLDSAHGLGADRGVLYAVKQDPDTIHINLSEYQSGIETPDFIPIVKTMKHLNRIHTRPLFDPGSGRLVACFLGRLVVMDFALIYKNLSVDSPSFVHQKQSTALKLSPKDCKQQVPRALIATE